LREEVFTPPGADTNDRLTIDANGKTLRAFGMIGN
jgi:hypothetical protein